MPSKRRRMIIQAAFGAALPAGVGAVEPLVVFAAASLSDVMQALARQLTPQVEVRFSFAASSTLARQIEQGAPAQLFVSADEAWMDYLAERGRIDVATRRVVAGNRLVVVRPGDTAVAPPGESVAALREALRPGPRGAERIATGDPAHVPAGRYAQAALTRLGLWNEIAPRLARADNVRSALSFVERGEAAAGIVYATDARVAHGLQVVARFPAGSHSPIRYPAALVRGASSAAHDFLAAISSAQAQPIWSAAGFESTG